MPKRKVVIIRRGPIGGSEHEYKNEVEALERALNDPENAWHGLEGIYAIESATVIVWRIA
jgi:hypothetical protein